MDEATRESAPWLAVGALLPVPPGAGAWGWARAVAGRIEFQSVAHAGELAQRIREEEHLPLFGWGPEQRHLRPIYEIEAVAADVETRARNDAERALRTSRGPLLGTLLLAVAAVVFWPAERQQQFLALVLLIFVLLPLWRRGVERGWEAWSSLRALARDPAEWRDRQARRLRFSAWSSRGRSVAGYVLVGMFVLTWLAMLRAGEQAAIERLALDEERIRAGEWWRLLTCAFLHAGPVHLFFNGSAGIALANLARTLVDESRLLLVFLLAALCGSLASFALPPRVISLGASGGILGWGGLLLGLAATHPALRHCGLVSGMLRWVVLLALIGLAGAGFIDNAAHAGGFLAGVIAGVLFARRARLPIRSGPSRSGWAAILLLGAAGWAWILWELV